MRIFVSIISYRDPLLYNTIRSLLDNQSGLCAITIGIFEQTKFDDSLESKHPELLQIPEIIYKRIDPEHSDGVGWARHINSLQMQNADFYYQIDSHMLFDLNWDRELIKDYELALKKYKTDKIVITASCKDFGIAENGNLIKHIVTPISCKSTYYIFQKTKILYAHGEYVAAKDDVSDGIHIFAGNMFTTSNWVKEVGSHPKIFFHGEEQYLTMASFAAGYQICHPREIHCYHYNESTNYITKQWIEPVVKENRMKRNERISTNEFRAFLLQLDDRVYEAYRKYSGVDYLNRKIEKRAISWTFKAPPDVVNDWEIPDRTD